MMYLIGQLGVILPLNINLLHVVLLAAHVLFKLPFVFQFQQFILLRVLN